MSSLYELIPCPHCLGLGLIPTDEYLESQSLGIESEFKGRDCSICGGLARVYVMKDNIRKYDPSSKRSYD